MYSAVAADLKTENGASTNSFSSRKEQAYAAIAENGIDALATMDSLEHVSGPDMEDCSDSHMPSAVRQALTEVLLRS